jgi:hypothetical protein
MRPVRIQPSELHIALMHPLIVLSHPTWWIAYSRHGRTGLIRQMTQDSLTAVRKSPIPNNLREISELRPHTVLGRMGLTQEYLYHLVRFLKPEIVIETGVYFGISSSFILEALDANQKGRLYSIDLPSAVYKVQFTGQDFTQPLREGETSGFAVPERLRHRWTLRLGDSRTELPQLLSELARVDMFYHDSEHTYEFVSRELQLVTSKMKPGSLLCADDIDWNTAFQDFLSKRSMNLHYNVKGKLGFAPVISEN